MSEMTPQQRREFLLEGTRTGKVATTRKDGRPHVVPVWIGLDGDDVMFLTARSSVKGRAIRRDGRAAVCVDDERRPYAFVSIEGPTATTEEHEQVLDWSTRIAERYVGKEDAERYGELNAGEGTMLVRLTPQHVVSETAITFD